MLHVCYVLLVCVFRTVLRVFVYLRPLCQKAFKRDPLFFLYKILFLEHYSDDSVMQVNRKKDKIKQCCTAHCIQLHV